MRTEFRRWMEIPSRHADGGREYYYEFAVHLPGTTLPGPGSDTFDPPPGRQHHSEPSRPMRPPHGPRTRPFRDPRRPADDSAAS